MGHLYRYLKSLLDQSGIHKYSYTRDGARSCHLCGYPTAWQCFTCRKPFCYECCKNHVPHTEFSGHPDP